MATSRLGKVKAKLDPVYIVEAWSIQALNSHDIGNNTETQHYNNDSNYHIYVCFFLIARE